MAVSNSLAPQRGGKQTFSAFLTSDAIKHRINGMVGSKDGQRFITSIISAVSINPALAECDHGTILSAALQGEALKLSRPRNWGSTTWCHTATKAGLQGGPVPGWL